MKVTKTRIALALAAALSLAACETPPTKDTKGTVAGAVVGGVVGSAIGGGTGRTAAIVAGTLAGALIGGHIGRKMDEADRLKAAQALESTSTGQSSSWKNPDTGTQYTMTPTRTYEESGSPCRDYTVNAMVDGKPEKVQGSACRQSDGSWKNMG